MEDNQRKSGREAKSGGRKLKARRKEIQIDFLAPPMAFDSQGLEFIHNSSAPTSHLAFGPAPQSGAAESPRSDAGDPREAIPRIKTP